MFKLIFFVPESHLEVVKSAVFAAGAGRLGNYDHCSWQTIGVGQFRPLPDSRPFAGTINQLEHLPEYRVEMVCENALSNRPLLLYDKLIPMKSQHLMYFLSLRLSDE